MMRDNHMHKNNILIVDDDHELLSNLSEILRDRGYQTTEASSGQEALDKAASEGFDIVLLDQTMPKISGMDVLVELKKIRPRIKIIMITAFATIDNATQAIKKGASDYISKPFNVEDLDATISRTLEVRRFEDGIKKLDLDFTMSALSNFIRRKVMKLLNMNQGMRLMELTRALELDDHTKLVFHLRTLKDRGLIKQDTEKIYYLTKEGEKTLSCLKVLEKHLEK